MPDADRPTDEMLRTMIANADTSLRQAPPYDGRSSTRRQVKQLAAELLEMRESQYRLWDTCERLRADYQAMKAHFTAAGITEPGELAGFVKAATYLHAEIDHLFQVGLSTRQRCALMALNAHRERLTQRKTDQTSSDGSSVGDSSTSTGIGTPKMS